MCNSSSWFYVSVLVMCMHVCMLYTCVRVFTCTSKGKKRKGEKSCISKEYFFVCAMCNGSSNGRPAPRPQGTRWEAIEYLNLYIGLNIWMFESTYRFECLSVWVFGCLNMSECVWGFKCLNRSNWSSVCTVFAFDSILNLILNPHFFEFKQGETAGAVGRAAATALHPTPLRRFENSKFHVLYKYYNM